MLNSLETRSRGISAVEVLIALAVLVVVGLFVLPSKDTSAAKAEMQTAVDNLEQAIYLARSTAINSQVDVIMHLQSNPSDEPDRLTFSFAKPAANLDPGALDHEYVFPAEIRLETAANEVLFNSLGKVESPARIELISNRDAGFNQRLLIE